MVKGKVFLLLVCVISLISIVGCKSNKENIYTYDDFVSEMKDKGYNLNFRDVDKDFLKGERKRADIGNEAIDINIYNNNEDMEKDAQYVDKDGGGYDNGRYATKVCWSTYPYFYKKGNIIVLYVGEDKKVVKDLESILGKQFAGNI